MPNYVRTRVGIYEYDEEKPYFLDESQTLYISNKNKLAIPEKDVIKKSNNLSDLVDGYWWENTHYTDPIFNPNVHIAKEHLNSWLESDKLLGTNLIKDITVYGSIYIKGQGWKHLSKLIYNSGKDDFEEELIG